MNLLSRGEPALHRVLVLIPGTCNYFYNQSGTRVAEALRALGLHVDVATLAEYPRDHYDYAILSNLTEVIGTVGDEVAAIEKVRALRKTCRTVVTLAIDCVQTYWYRRIHQFAIWCELDAILDLGLYDQSPLLDEACRNPALYRFVFSGLTPSEARLLAAPDWNDARRSLPWALVGHNTPYRIALVDHLIQTVSPQGFVYTPELAAYTESGSPHLNQQQFEQVLRHTRYQIWRSHHTHFYLEPERFRMSLLTGSVPIKIVESRSDVPRSAPFTYLLLEPRDTAQRLTAKFFDRIRHRFQQQWRGLPTLTDELARWLRLSTVPPALSLAQAG